MAATTTRVSPNHIGPALIAPATEDTRRSSIFPLSGKLPAHPQAAQYAKAELAFLYVKDNTKQTIRWGSYFAFWTERFLQTFSPATQAEFKLPNPQAIGRFGGEMARFKNVLSALEVPEKASNVYEDLQKLKKVSFDPKAKWGDVGNATLKMVMNTGNLISCSCDGVEFFGAPGLMNLTKETAFKFKVLSLSATFVGSGASAFDNTRKIWKEWRADNLWSVETGYHLINLAGNASYVALGMLGLFITGLPMVPWQAVACLTSGVFFNTCSYFYDRLYDPEHKGRNLHPIRVRDDVWNQLHPPKDSAEDSKTVRRSMSVNAPNLGIGGSGSGSY